MFSSTALASKLSFISKNWSELDGKIRGKFFVTI
jgi:hypothetical protein